MGFWFSPPVRVAQAPSISPLPHTPFTTLAILQTSLLPSRVGSARNSFDSVSSVSSVSSISSVASDVRAQGVLVLTYALRTVRGADSEKLRVVRELEDALGEVAEGEYRDRVYTLGGKLERCVDLAEVGGLL